MPAGALGATINQVGKKDHGQTHGHSTARRHYVQVESECQGADMTFPADLATEAAAIIPAARAVILDDAGHMAHIDQPVS